MAPTDPRVLRPPQWYKDAVIYEVHVRAFADSNDDGIGDFPGLTSRLDYLSRLGVTAIWLLPFYPSPLRDDGYDIAEYYDVHPSYGTLDDFTAFLDAAHAQNMQVITEVVINHTSDQHPWFQRARRAEPGSAERDFYVWSDTPDRYGEVRIIFQDTELSNWAWDPVAGAYYWHRFFSHQPDLNYDSPHVKEAVTDVLRFWLDMGVDGVRLDAIPYLFERDGTNGENLPETHQELKRLRAFVDDNYDNRMLLAEANQWPEDSVAYFGDGDECHMAFHFPVMPRLYLALQRETRLPIVDILEQTPPIPHDAQWAIFLRNHDELTLEMVSEEEREFMWRTYAPDRRARLNLGIRRRLAPLLENDRRRIELLFGLLLSLPGTPVLYYGDEIGMGDNVFLADRDGVRTPMQWSSDRNAGFSRANPQSLYLPVVVDPQYHFETVNVEAQHANPNSLLWWLRRMIRRRHRHPVFGRGGLEFLEPDNDRVLAYLREDGDETILVVVNLSRHAQFVELDLGRFAGRRPVELLGGTDFPMVGELPYLLTLGSYGFYWFSLPGDSAAADRTAGPIAVPGSLEDAFVPEEPLPDLVGDHLVAQPWYRGDGRQRLQTTVHDLIPLTPADADPALWIGLVDIEYARGPVERYVVPIGIRFADAAPTDDALIAQIDHQGRAGVVYDALADPEFRRRIVEGVLEGRTLLGRAGSLACGAGSTPVPAAHAAAGESTVTTTPRGETYIDYGTGLALKLYRHTEAGVNPDLELRRFLTDRTGFDNVADVYGALEYESGDAFTLGVLQQSFARAPTAWSAFGELCRDWLKAIRVDAPSAEPPARDWATTEAPEQRLPAPKALAPALELAGRLAVTTAELHQAIGSLSEEPDLRPQPFSTLYQNSLYQSLRASLRQAFRSIRRVAADDDSDVAAALRDIGTAEAEALDRLDPIRRARISGRRIRVHGDYRLDEIRIVDGEFFIEDLSGDRVQPLSERRLRASPLRDVAEMLRSIDYVAARSALDAPPDKRPWGPWWSRAVGLRFVQAYIEAMEDSPSLPDDAAGADALLNAYTLTRGLRELQWELNMRPDWTVVPLAGVRRMLGRHPSLLA